VSADFLQALGRPTQRLEREFNRRAGFIAADDRLSEWMTCEPPPHKAVFDVSEGELDAIFAER
jgi:aldehyde:ferredoxin oxidoreductase